MKQIKAAAVLVFLLVGCGKGFENDFGASEILGCDDGGSDGSTDGPDLGGSSSAYGLNGCGNPSGGDLGLIGEVGRIHVDGSREPAAPLFPGKSNAGHEGACLADGCNSEEAPAPLDWFSAKHPMPLDLQLKVSTVGMLPPEERAAAYRTIAKELLRKHAEGDAGMQPDIGGHVVDLLNRANQYDPTGIVIGFKYDKYNAGGSSSETGTIESTTGVVKANGESSASVSGMASAQLPRLPGAAGSLSVEGRATVGAGASIETSKASMREAKRTENDPPREKERIVIIQCKSNGQTVEIGMLRDEIDAFIGFDLRETSGGRADFGPSVDPDAAERRRQQETARRLAEARLRRQNLLDETRRRELEALVNAPIVYRIMSRVTHDFVDIEPRHINSYNYIYDTFPGVLANSLRRLEGANNTYFSALEELSASSENMTVYLRSAASELEGPSVATDRLQQLAREVLSWKGTFCPQRSISQQRLKLELAIADIEEISALFKRHAAIIRDIEPEDTLTSWVDARTGSVMAASRELLASSLGNAKRACETLDDLHAASVKKIAANRAQEFDAAAITLSDAAMAMIEESSRKIKAADTESSYIAGARILAENINEARLLNKLTETEFAVRDAREFASKARDEVHLLSYLEVDEKERIKSGVTDLIESAVRRFSDSLARDTVGTFVYARLDALQQRLTQVRHLIGGAGDRKGGMLFAWRGYVAASGLRVASGCLDDANALSDECWTIEYAWDLASDADLRRFDAELSDLERMLDKFAASSNRLGDQ
jgi:hypothetical protein